jgi:uncharacterized C2H2 Zn-finger protein
MQCNNQILFEFWVVVVVVKDGEIFREMPPCNAIFSLDATTQTHARQPPT